jgi:hypothetical protein
VAEFWLQISNTSLNHHNNMEKMTKEVLLIKTQAFGWVIGWQVIDDNDQLPMTYYKGFDLWDDRLDMAEFYDSEEEAIYVCNSRGYQII